MRNKGSIGHIGSWLASLSPFPATLAQLEKCARRDLETTDDAALRDALDTLITVLVIERDIKKYTPLPYQW